MGKITGSSSNTEFEMPTFHNWTPLAKKYHPLQAGSIDGTDQVPHDNAVWRAMQAKYKPNKQVAGDAGCTLFVGRLSKETRAETLVEAFSKYGEVENCRLVRDFVTGFSRGYAFVEFKERWDAKTAYREISKCCIDGQEILVEFEAGRNLEGWIPRRLGGGFGGKKESGQLRFGGRDRPFRRPLPIQGAGEETKQDDVIPRDRTTLRDQRYRDNEDRERHQRGRDRHHRDRDDSGCRFRDNEGKRYSDLRHDGDKIYRDRDNEGKRNRDASDGRDRSYRDRDRRSREEREPRPERESDRDSNRQKHQRDRHREKSTHRRESSRDHRDRRKDT
ncbi:U11/U12 small nuclear ribonucleoprotein 35 kDa protein [Nematostella vectensis]|uniref:U11/U12 small nuclear ribonucleoprotein 35 kDa protein n=1 Tax=Nematostella vectensis TaxID=45351 RepID=UPI002076DC86|nr:U11/U12 small nuclear ribonucleoprotein 35 kDa protein [Nematostella vectensis]